MPYALILAVVSAQLATPTSPRPSPSVTDAQMRAFAVQYIYPKMNCAGPALMRLSAHTGEILIAVDADQLGFSVEGEGSRWRLLRLLPAAPDDSFSFLPPEYEGRVKFEFDSGCADGTAVVALVDLNFAFRFGGAPEGPAGRVVLSEDGLYEICAAVQVAMEEYDRSFAAGKRDWRREAIEAYEQLVRVRSESGPCGNCTSGGPGAAYASIGGCPAPPTSSAVACYPGKYACCVCGISGNGPALCICCDS